MADRRLRSRDVALGAAFLGLAATSVGCGFGSVGPPDDPHYQPNYSSGSYGDPGTVYDPPPVQLNTPIPPAPDPVYTPDEDTYVFYCVDETELIVDPGNCDANVALDDTWPYFLAFSTLYARNLRPGMRLPSGGDMFNASDTSARSGWGLPSRITNGSTVRLGIVGGSGSGTVGS
ncbi:hypothetical protein [Catellatospora sp. NPDC049609]|uniref:hypothetical protein n=1 Tax=Catellatospora sp. NPDC049609 TaxID=3155505 RepID=UPI00342376B5